MSVLNSTVACYVSPEGAKAYIDKEAKHAAARNAHCWRLLDDIAKPGKVAVDMACGFGRDVAEMRKRGMVAWGVDISPVLLAEAKKLYGGEEWMEGDMLTMVTPPVQPVDLLWSAASMVHVPREMMQRVLTTWWSWIKPGGYMVIVTKEGTGERMMDNLGTEHPRLMVYYKAQEFLNVLEPLGARAVWRVEGETGHGLPTGDSLMELVLRK